MKEKTHNKYMNGYMKRGYVALKIKAVRYKGGQCELCGYSKCFGALEFHHKNPLEKEFDWSSLRKRSWGTIVEELDKCSILCANCHREVHHDQERWNIAEQWLDKPKRLFLESRICLECNFEFKPKRSEQKYCSRSCADKNRNETRGNG